MGTIKVTGLAKSFGVHELFKGVSFEIARGDKVGFVGANGAGKTTLLSCLLGQEEYDAGTIARDEADTVGYVEQAAELGTGTLYECFKEAFADILSLGAKKAELEERLKTAQEDAALLEAYSRVVNRFEALGGYDYESQLRRVAFGLGFTEKDFHKDVRHFSGGQKTRIALARALMRSPDFLFLDEPTNHLDIGMIEWLESFLREYPGGVLLISHDRFFLDRVATRILELDHQAVTAYAGNYSYFLKVKTERRAALASAYEKQQAQIKKTEEYIRRYRAGIKSKQARGRQSQLNRLERIVLPPEDARFTYFKFHQPTECAERVAEMEDVAWRYGEHTLFEHLSLLIRRGDGVALVGPNGAGKTTLLKILVGELAPATGRVKLGSRVKIGYFSQEHEGLNMANTVLGEICDNFGTTEEQARSYLGAFLFHGDDVLRRVGDLSGGEQSRVAFLKLMLTGANFLVLDEPTNHLDIPAKEAVEEALMAYPGTFLAVSHDRYFLDKVANTTLALENGELREFLGNYSYYRAKVEEEREAAALETPSALTGTSPLRGGGKGSEKAAGPATASVDSDKSFAKGNAPRTTQTPPAGGGVERSETEGVSGASPKKQTKSLPTNLTPEKRAALLARAEAELLMAEAELKGIEHEMNDPEAQKDPMRSQELADAYAKKAAEIEERYAKWGELAGA